MRRANPAELDLFIQVRLIVKGNFSAVFLSSISVIWFSAGRGVPEPVRRRCAHGSAGVCLHTLTSVSGSFQFVGLTPNSGDEVKASLNTHFCLDEGVIYANLTEDFTAAAKEVFRPVCFSAVQQDVTMDVNGISLTVKPMGQFVFGAN